MKVIPYGKQVIDSSDIAAVVGALRSDWITQGPKITEFEGALSRYCGSKYAVAVSSGTAALHLAALSLSLKKGDEVITSPLSFAATANAVVYAGAKPVFADVAEDTGNISPEEIQKKITKKTKAIIAVDFAGHPAELVDIYKIARKHNLKVIEDAAQSLGAQYKSGSSWIKIGSCQHSDMTIFSFHPVKSITTGEGGAILTNDTRLYKKLILLRTHGVTRDPQLLKNDHSAVNGPWYYEMQELGFNYRITDIQCALGISQLKKLDKFISQRRKIATIYQRELVSIKDIELPTEKKKVKSAWHLYCIRLKDQLAQKRKTIFNRLREKNIGAQVHFIPIYFHPFYKKLGYKRGLCPLAESFYASEITIPMYPSLKLKEIKYVAQTLGDICKELK